ncbi:hypothetical protein [Akkermansia sp.]|uniref:hypothetical protein n=1 Tax=Akkermansia sp. TaxID=1872421 RepID=UPI0025BF6D77|nr:hypothetical protein [Akkermansia sp.]MCC8148957.1 hypothetical protein [Akkermansia sp.]
MILSKLFIMAACCLGVYGAENSIATQHDQAGASSEQRNDTAVPNLQYIDLYCRWVCSDLSELKGILNSISAPVTNRDEEEKISIYFERNVEYIGAFITQMEEDVRFATTVVENQKAIQNARMKMSSALESCSDVLDKLGEKQFLSKDFINTVKVKMIILFPYKDDSGNVFKFKPDDVFKQEYVDSFQDKSYPYLLQGFFVLHKARDRKEARKLFEKSAELGNEEARVMAAFCDQPKARELMDKVQRTLERMNILASRIIDPQTASAHEDELAALFDTLRFTVKMLNRSHLSAEDTVYVQSTWGPAFLNLGAQFFNEKGKHIQASQYFGSDKLKSSMSGEFVELDMYLDLKTTIQQTYDQTLKERASQGGNPQGNQ